MVLEEIADQVNTSAFSYLFHLLSLIVYCSDDRSVCTLFEDCDHQERSKHVCHCYKDTEIDQKSWVYNGSLVGADTSEIIRKHHLNGGSVKNESKLVNGDLPDREAFLAFFCNNSDEKPSTSRS